ncbi:sensor histidine kinase [Paenibacillus pini]|uniref:histidine kinase n=1 Tax=Paenibacillus pini JCM 16418 TaxID=1236976 RepID=W7Z1C3_9BACL|nr:sensor histidine kinase [Paenibacillus pini]GAF08154.1 sensor histidine kinase [Paenibacillus pini JCM 16418]
MILALLVVIALLLFWNGFQYFSRKNRNQDIQYMTSKLSRILNESSSEQLMVVTDDHHIRSLLSVINEMLTMKLQTEADFTRTELAMRRMLSNISHDLKTPLTVVLGYMETLLRHPELSPLEREKLLIKVHAKAGEVVELMNRFFDLAKLESGDKELPLTRVHMNEICRNNMLMFYDSIESHGFEVVIDIQDAPIYAWANEEALDRALGNLLSNAIRYGNDGKAIGMALRSDEQHVYIDVWDQGKGISEREQELIFERMYTLEDSRNKAFQGSGLGLTITKRLIEQLEGDIQVRSKPYAQTVFTIRLRRLS